MGCPVRLIGVNVENLRGYSSTALTFPSIRILVGENNEGKSSLLKMLDSLVNDLDEQFWGGDRYLSTRDIEFWMPANETAGRARRLTLLIEMSDGRVSKKFGLKKGDIARLRFGIKKVDGRVRLNVGAPKRGEKHDPVATELLFKLQSCLRLIVIPPVRDATTSRFSDSLVRDFKESLVARFTHPGRGGAWKEYRKAKSIIDDLSNIVDEHSVPIQISGETVLSRMVRASKVRFSASTDDLLSWVLENVGVALSTGEHDELMVSPKEVGNGLQSVIDLSLAIARAKPSDSNIDLIIVVEEPEAFLHPSAQRELMNSVRNHCQTENCRMVITTHSPIVIDEAKFPEVALVRSHKFYEPECTDDQRDEINTSYLSTQAAEVFFADVVLLVEGVTDFAFLNTLVKRYRASNPDLHGLSKIHVQPVGGKTCFAPWIKLFEAYGDRDDRPIHFVCLVDADALAKEGGKKCAVETALSDCQKKLSAELEKLIDEFSGMKWDEFNGRRESAKELNKLLNKYQFHTFSVDLEWEIVSNLTPKTRNKVLNIAGLDSDADQVSLARKLGSKAGTGKASSGRLKPAHIPTSIAQIVDHSDISEITRSLMDHLTSLSSSGPKTGLNFEGDV